MKFVEIVGGAADTDEIKSAIAACQEKLTSVCIELSTSYENRSQGSSGLGGDIAILHLIQGCSIYADISSFTLKKLEAEQDTLIKKLEGDISDADKEEVIKHLKALNIAIAQCESTGIFTAATDGKKMWFSVEFMNKLSKLGARFVVAHEATHIQYNHPAQRGHRDPALYNIAIDLKNNYFQILDANTRLQKSNSSQSKDGAELFRQNLGEFITFDEYKAFLTDPFNPPKKLAHLSPIHAMKKQADSTYIAPGKDLPPFYFAEPNLSDDMKRPANIYDALYNAVPRCPECNRWGVYPKNKEVKELEKKMKVEKHGPCCIDHKHNGKDCCEHNHDPKHCPFSDPSHCSNCGCKSCDPKCSGDGMPLDVIGMAGSLLDRHMDNQLTEDEMEKKLREANNLAKQYGYGAGYAAEELARLSKPKMRWQDMVIWLVSRKKQGYGRNNWNLPRIKPLIAGLYTPKRQEINVNVVVGIDCSGSMSNEDIAHGISQLQVLGNKASIWVIPWDTKAYFEQMVHIKMRTPRPCNEK